MTGFLFDYNEKSNKNHCYDQNFLFVPFFHSRLIVKYYENTDKKLFGFSIHHIFLLNREYPRIPASIVQIYFFF